MSGDFRNYLYSLDHPQLQGLSGLDPCTYTDLVLARPGLGQALGQWLSLFEEADFDTGITSDGTARTGLYPLGGKEDTPVKQAAHAARKLIDALAPGDRKRLCHPLNSKVWRAWMNPELYLNRFGLRLEELASADVERALDLLRASLSPAGYAKVRQLMRINELLGRLVGLPKILNIDSYNINVFGDPTGAGPWGWSFYGHHICLNCLFIGDQQVFTPVFFGAEPSEIDDGPFEGTAVFADQESHGLRFIRSLPATLADDAILFRDKRDPAMPVGRRHPADDLHLGGAFQDNRVIPYEVLEVARMDDAQQQLLIDLVELFLDYQPDGPRCARLADVRRHLSDTWFCWIDGTNAGDTFYYRIQSPVILVEFDHHSGVFLANTEPRRFHIHTIVRTPNGNDYGVDLIRQATGASYRLDGPS